MKIRWQRRATLALTTIYAHIAADNPPAANALRDRVLDFVETKLASHPAIGRPGRVDGTRESVIHPSYVLVYRVKGEVVEILTIRHSARRWPTSFEP